MPTLYWPFPTSTVTEWPGQRPGSYHVGTDFGIAQGTPLKATATGTVSRWTDQYGAYIIDIRTPDGFTIRHGHLSRIDVSNGQQVTAGQVIGLTGGIPGTPGAGWSTGAHLHWEIRQGSNWFDPRNLNPQPLTFGSEPTARKKGGNEMLMINKIGSNPVQWAIFGTNFWLEFVGNDTANWFAAQFTNNALSVPVSPDFWNYCKQVATSPVQVNVNASGDVDTVKLAKAVNDEIAKRMAG